MHYCGMIPTRLSLLFASALVMAAVGQSATSQRVFNVRDYGATGRKSDDARPALQKAIDACGKAGGGQVYFPPGEYTSGQLHLRSGVRLYVEGGATIYATLDSRQYDDAKKAALIYGEDLHDIALEGAGTLDGQATYEWHLNSIVDHYILSNQHQTMKYARNVAMNDVEIVWEEPYSTKWQSGLVVDDVEDLSLGGTRIDAAPSSNQPVLRLNDANGVLIRQSSIASVAITGSKSRAVRLLETEANVTLAPGLAPVIVK